MKLIDAQQKLLMLNVPIINTADAAACLNISIVNASQILRRLSKSGLFIHLSKGKWILTKKLDPFLIPEYLTAPFPSYISLQSALLHHGMITQIPAVIYAVSLARSRRHNTPFETISIHHINSNLFFGFDFITKTQIKMATPEKALWDILYFSPTRTHLFKALPELELPVNFKLSQVSQWIKKVRSSQRRTLMQKMLEKILSQQKNL